MSAPSIAVVEEHVRKPDTSEEARSDQDKDAGARKADPSQEKTDGDVNIPAIVAVDRLNEIARERTLERDR
ncbi:MAG: hypothetical protein P8M25_02010 [Paracoccaceae bacterium]|nr:hypothetical protein [Paracoccaceae bacterium]